MDERFKTSLFFFFLIVCFPLHPIFKERVSYFCLIYSELVLGWTVRDSNPGLSKIFFKF